MPWPISGATSGSPFGGGFGSTPSLGYVASANPYPQAQGSSWNGGSWKMDNGILNPYNQFANPYNFGLPQPAQNGILQNLSSAVYNGWATGPNGGNSLAGGIARNLLQGILTSPDNQYSLPSYQYGQGNSGGGYGGYGGPSGGFAPSGYGYGGYPPPAQQQGPLYAYSYTPTNMIIEVDDASQLQDIFNGNFMDYLNPGDGSYVSDSSWGDEFYGADGYYADDSGEPVYDYWSDFVNQYMQSQQQNEFQRSPQLQPLPIPRAQPIAAIATAV